MSDVYLIKKETLTNIADKIRQYGNYVEGVTFTPENMPDEIYDVYIAGRDYGYDIGYDTALNSLPTPLVIQAKATPTYNSNLDEYYFTYTTFNTDEGDFDRFFDWEVLDSESSLSIALTNFTDRYLYVYMYYTLLDGDYESLFRSSAVPHL